MFLTSPRLLPWSSWDEWRLCYDLVERVSAGGPGIATLVRIAAAWSLRGRTPLAAASTLALLAVLRGGGENEGSLGLLIIRLVNGITDSAQTGVSAASIAELARRIGFPRWVVDLRHDLTHGTAPDIAVLRLAAAHSVQWLLERYWRTQAAALAAITGAHMAPAIAAAFSSIVAATPTVRLAPASRRRSSGPNASPRDAGLTTTTTNASAARMDVRLLLFSRSTLRTINAACGGDASRLVVDADVATAARVALRNLALTTPMALFGDVTAGASVAPLAALARTAVQSSAAGYEWIDSALVGPLVRNPGWLLKPTNPPLPLQPPPSQQPAFSPFSPLSSHSESITPAPRLSSPLPSTRAQFEPAFRTWLPLLVALQLSAPGTVRLLSRALAIESEKTIDDPLRTAAANAWLWLIKSRYWHSLFDWSLLAAPRRRGNTGGGGGGGGGAMVQPMLYI